MKNFLSDNAAAIHPAVLAKIAEVNQGYAPAYGEDYYTQQAVSLFRQHFGNDIKVFFVLTGTAANVIALQSVMRSFEAVIAADCSHLQLDECGAAEKFLGSKLLLARTEQGKLTPETIAPLLRDTAMVHRAQPRVLSITQCTEWGTLYTPEEIRALSELCRKHHLLLHMDGARLCNAAVALGLSLQEASVELGVDILSFGGAKNGLMAAEAIVFFRAELAKNTGFYRKQGMQLMAKMRFVAAQFIALMEGDLWRQNARHANAMARLLREKTEDVVEIVAPVETNVVFARLQADRIPGLHENFDFAIWNTNESIVRWMTAFDTTEQDVTDFATEIRETVTAITKPRHKFETNE